MAFINRFSTVTRGGISFIGNTLGLSKQSDTLNPGTQGSIGAFTTLNNTQVTTFPVGTTSNYLENGINLGTLVPNQSATVSFTANVTATENMNVDNFSTSNFAIQQPDGSTTPGSSTSNTVTTNIVIEPNPPTPCIIVFECKCRSCCQPSYCGCDCHGCQCDRCKDCWKENCKKDCFDRCKDKWHGNCPNDKKCNRPIPSYTKCCQCKCRFRLKCCKDKNLNNLFDGISTLLNGIDQNTSTGLNYRTQTKFNIHSNCDRNVRRRNRY